MYAGGGGAYSALLLMMLQETVLTSACGMPRETLYHKPTSHRANHFCKCIFIGTWEFGNIFFILPPQPAYGVVRNLMDIWLCNTCELCAVIGSIEVKMFDNSLCLLVRIQCCMSAGLQNFNCYCDITWIWCFGLGLVYTRIQARMAIRVNRLGQYILGLIRCKVMALCWQFICKFMYAVYNVALSQFILIFLIAVACIFKVSFCYH